MKKMPLFIIFLVLIGFSISLGTEGRLGFAASSAIEPQAAGQPIFGCDNMLASNIPSLIIGFDGNPIIAWGDSSSMSEIYVKRWDGTAWVEMGMGSASMGGISNSGGLSREPIINLGSNGNPVIAWSDDTGGDSEIYVRKWE